MPNKNEKPLVNPSPSLMQRLGLASTPDPEFDARMTLAQNKMRQEMPNEMANASIKPTGLLGGLKDKLVAKMIGGAPVATTSPFGNITYNKDILKSMPQNEMEDTLAHELTHVKQFSEPGVNGAPPTLSTGHGIMNVLKQMIPRQDEGLPQETKSFYSSRGYDPGYRGSSVEMEAYQKEDERKNARGDILRPGEDIQLFPPRKPKGINTSPSPKVIK